jgi:predicted methyltransferase
MPFGFRLRPTDAYALVVGMTGVKLGEHVAQLGCTDTGVLGALAKRVGLSGQFVAYVPDEASAARARQGAANAGALADVEVAAPVSVPAESASFDLVVADDTGGFLNTLNDAARAAAVREAHRMLRPGGRFMVIGAAAVGGLSGWLRPGSSRQSADYEQVLEAGGFKLVRRLAERDGMVFVEGIRPRTED